MDISKFEIKDVLLLKPRVFGDERGYFLESFNKETFENLTGKSVNFIQDNESKSSFGVLRGLHFQVPPFEQAKLVRVIAGKVLDVAVDLRADSPTYGKHISTVLSGENKYQLFIPRGFAHGFIVLSETAIFAYKVDNIYAPSHDSGIIYNDADLEIDWQLDVSEIQLSDKDIHLKGFKEFREKRIF